ncbi:MAG: MarR family transcriptional regulator [Methanothrix sp.]|nr:MarR family transcriptional regulator [Methanothrix sp.]
MDVDGLDHLRRYIVDACIRSANIWGYGDAVGVLRGTLLLASEPMSLDQLVAETGYSKSTVSSNMSLLEDLGLARRIVKPGDKRYHYVPVTDPDSLKKAMLSTLRRETQLIMAALDTTEKELRARGLDFEEIVARIDRLRHFYRQSDRLLDLIAGYTTDELIQLLEGRREELP